MIGREAMNVRYATKFPNNLWLKGLTNHHSVKGVCRFQATFKERLYNSGQIRLSIGPHKYNIYTYIQFHPSDLVVLSSSAAL